MMNINKLTDLAKVLGGSFMLLQQIEVSAQNVTTAWEMEQLVGLVARQQEA